VRGGGVSVTLLHVVQSVIYTCHIGDGRDRDLHVVYIYIYIVELTICKTLVGAWPCPAFAI